MQSLKTESSVWNLYKVILSKDIEPVIKNLPTKKSSGLAHYMVNSIKHLKEQMPTLFKFFQKTKEEETTSKLTLWVGLHQTKRLLTAKEAINKNENAAYRMGKVFVNHITEKGHMSSVYKELTQLNGKK